MSLKISLTNFNSGYAVVIGQSLIPHRLLRYLALTTFGIVRRRVSIGDTEPRTDWFRNGTSAGDFVTITGYCSDLGFAATQPGCFNISQFPLKSSPPRSPPPLLAVSLT